MKFVMTQPLKLLLIFLLYNDIPPNLTTTGIKSKFGIASVNFPRASIHQYLGTSSQVWVLIVSAYSIKTTFYLKTETDWY